MAAADSGETPAPAQYKGKYCGNWMSRAKDYGTPGSLVVGGFFCFVLFFISGVFLCGLGYTEPFLVSFSYSWDHRRHQLHLIDSPGWGKG